MQKRLILVFIIIIIFVFGYKYIYHDHRNIQKEKSEFYSTAISLSNEFAINPVASEKKYLNKTIEIIGTISDVTNQSITLDNKVFCQFKNTLTDTIKINTKTNIKGRCIGYDDLLEEIKFDQCNLIIEK